MATYAVGDPQGCFEPLQRLLEEVGFDPGRDRLWCVGDLVNRGPGSLPILREVKALGDAARVVLGNHDLHLLTVAAGHREPHLSDTIDDVLGAPDRDALVGWLRSQPLVVREDDLLMVHAGLLPSWTAAHAQMLSGEVEAKLASDDAHRFLGVLYGDEPSAWRDDLEGDDRLRAIVNACTRMRFCTPDGRMEFREKRGREHAPEGFRPWFAHDHRRTAGETVVCGHWSTLELDLAPNVMMLDSGCLWGGTLTAVRLPDRRVFQVPSRHPVQPKPFG